MPASVATPNVTCSGVPSGNRCRQMWTPLLVKAVKYIHWPSGDHATSVHCAGDGPTAFPGELPSIGTRRQGSHDRPSISATITHFRSGEDDERWAMPSGGGGRYTVR